MTKRERVELYKKRHAAFREFMDLSTKLGDRVSVRIVQGGLNKRVLGHIRGGALVTDELPKKTKKKAKP